MIAALEQFATGEHERVLLVRDAAAGLLAVIALHDTTFGPAVGGTRMRSYASLDDALGDALRLSRAMTSKAVFAGMACGGGKAVIVGDPATRKTPQLLKAYGRAVDTLQGSFFTGPDMGIDSGDLAVIGSVTRHVGQVPAGAGQDGIDAADLTAIGVHVSMRETARRLGKPLADCRVAIQGVGEVGGRLARRLAAEGASLVLADAVVERGAQVARETGGRHVACEAIAAEPCDIHSPNAVGGLITESLASELPCRAVVGAANNPLASDRAGEILHARGVLYAPDFVVNAGGLLSVLFETGELDAVEIVRRVERIGSDLGELLDEAAADGLPPFRAADRTVTRRLAAGRAAKRVP